MTTSTRNVHTVVVDWDGTAVPQVWPELATEFMPGFAKAMRRLHEAGFRIVIASASLSPLDPFTGAERDPGEVFTRVHHMRALLDDAGLTFVDIWTHPGKPGGSVYIDDKAERYTGRPGSWDAVTTKVLMRLGKEAPEFPAFDLTAA